MLNRNKYRQRSVSDVKKRPERSRLVRCLERFFGLHIVNLKPKFYIRHPWFAVAGSLLIIVFGLIDLRQLFTRAEVADFYPSVCLGTWQNPANAQGQPETLDNPSSTFGKENSAVYNGGATQIFCGGFLPPDFKTEGNIKNVGLTLVWQVGEPSSTNISASSTSIILSPTSTIPQTEPPAATSTPLESQSSTTSLLNSTIGSEKKVNAEHLFSASARPSQPKRLLRRSRQPIDETKFHKFYVLNPLFFDIAFAEETSSTSVSSTTATAPANETTTPAQAPAQTASTTAPAASSTSLSSTKPSSSTETPTTTSTIIVVPTSTSTPTPTSTAPQPLPISTPTSTPEISTSTASSTVPAALPPAAQPPAPDENFLEISYSTDGQNWIELGKTNTQNWRNLTLTVPITSWDDLKKLQIRIEGIPTTLNPLPPVYLDGMLLEVHYEVPPILSGEGNNNQQNPEVVEVSPNVTITMPPPPQPFPLVPPPNIVSITKANDTVKVVIQYVGDFYEGNPLYVFMYPLGTTAERNGADSAYTFAGQPMEGPSLNPIPLGAQAFDMTTKQATLTIVSPSSDNILSIAADSMASGTYGIDVSYYDGGTWHLVPAQTFTWP